MVTHVKTLRRLSLLFATVLSVASMLFAQADQPQAPSPDVPQVMYELTWRGADPQWFQVAIDSTGRATYQSQARTNPGETPGEPFILKWTASEKLKNEVFTLAKELDYFRGDLDYKGNQRLANTGDKTLSYTAEGKTSKATFNFSPNPKAEELSSIFQQLSTCFEIGRRLEYALRFDKLGIDQQLKQLETLQRRGYLPGLPALVPTLERVLADRSTMNISRQRANFLLYAARQER